MAVPARFLVACNKGHLDDFPWLEFVHRGPTDCQGPLYLYEVGASGEAADVEVNCDKCGNYAAAWPRRSGGTTRRTCLPAGVAGPTCGTSTPRAATCRTSSRSCKGRRTPGSPCMISALSVPQATDKLAQLVDENWAVLEKAQSREVVAAFRAIGQLKDFGKYTDEEIWAAVEKKRQGGDEATDEPADLKSPEWEVFSDPASAQESKFFKLRTVDPPDDFTKYFEKIVLVEKLREVRALIGFTRIESPRDFDSPLDVPPERRMRLSRRDPTWVPASETRGEGIFFQFSEKADPEVGGEDQEVRRRVLRGPQAVAGVEEPAQPGVGLSRPALHPAAHLRPRRHPATGRRVRLHDGLDLRADLLPQPGRRRADGRRADLHVGPGQRRNARRAVRPGRAEQARPASAAGVGQDGPVRLGPALRRAPIPAAATSCTGRRATPARSCRRRPANVATSTWTARCW